ncbi:MAG: hypothetical protein V2B18_06495 [Pseudomonadota bacterium]
MGLFDLFKKKKRDRPVVPETSVVVSFDEDRVWCSRPGRSEESMAWSELKGVGIRTTNDGPFNPDVFWILGADNATLIFPQGATGEDALLRRLQDLPGFDNEELSRAMTCTGNDSFILWQRDPRP